MTKQSGLGDRLYVAGCDVSGDIGSVDTISSPIAMLPGTDITQSGTGRMHGLRDGAIDFTSYFDVATGASHDVFSTLPTADRIVTYCRGAALGSPAASMVAKQLDYPLKRDDKGALTFGIKTLANRYGLEWGDQLTPGKKTVTATGALTGLDLASTSNFGLQAYLHVFTMTGTDATIVLEDSNDNGSADAYAPVTGGGFAQVLLADVPTAARIQSGRTQAVKRWVRVNVSGTFTSLSFMVAVTKNRVAVNF